MTDESFAKTSRRHRHHWRRDLAELAALFTAVAAADSVANTVAHGPDGPVLLVSSAAALLATAGFHIWWSRRRDHAPPPSAADAATPSPRTARPCDESTLWRMRTTVRDEPGSLAALCLSLAERGVDILALQTHPLADGTVDELLLRAPAALAPAELTGAAAQGGGRQTWLERADAHDLVDAPTRVLNLATRTALDAAELPLALRQLLGRCTIRSIPARSPHTGAPCEPVPESGVWEETVLRLRDPSGGSITIERPYLPFTPTEFARARALVELDTRLGPRVPLRSDVLTLPEGNEITVRRAGPDDLAAAREMHERCSTATLTRRYHGPVGDADRYLRHLLTPRFGRTLAAYTASGRLVALGHLLWDGDETEVALLVEDEWQRRGVGGELLERLTGMAREARCESVYAVTTASNTAMVAAMRAQGLPLDYQVEEGTLVITARLAPQPIPSTAAMRPGHHVSDS
ncbi:GNAT superfamily N-acetyltransferase [Streptomyces olivoverticillatus]|uniref:GNAT superfamily N-acetyltransferase n=1 Tax=Streptomyces olivoverticillatus TaxID=66427 RepID=A0A7W7PKK0_9ACTN|nr:GNAT family N-acetyltransferase [Streptomyces olivoverticillatus]MBB4893312.1 GNAT superfamily N-acetyltransferase [Streptomyces olivoverticillatus]